MHRPFSFAYLPTQMDEIEQAPLKICGVRDALQETSLLIKSDKSYHCVLIESFLERFFECIFTIFSKIQNRNNSVLSTSKHRRAKFRSFLCLFWYNCLTCLQNGASVYENVHIDSLARTEIFVFTYLVIIKKIKSQGEKEITQCYLLRNKPLQEGGKK